MFRSGYFLHNWHASARTPEADSADRQTFYRARRTSTCDLETDNRVVGCLPSGSCTVGGVFAERLGNDRFPSPSHETNVLKGIARHDDGWDRSGATRRLRGRGSRARFPRTGRQSILRLRRSISSINLAVPGSRRTIDRGRDPYAALLISDAYVQLAARFMRIARRSRQEQLLC